MQLSQFKMICILAVIIPSSSGRSEEFPTRKYDTIGHRILDLDAEASPVTIDHYEVLDALIDGALAEIKYEPDLEERSHRRAQAIRIFSQIGNLLVRHQFRLQIGVKTLSEGLTKKFDRYGRGYYTYDCDTGSFLYLAIAEELNLPITLVEVKFRGSQFNHNFVRWDLGDRKFFDWDCNARYIRKPTTPNGFYGTSFSPERVKAYALYLRGKTWEDAGNIEKAIEDYRLAHKIDPEHPHVANNLAWLFVSNRDAQNILTVEEALATAEAGNKSDSDANTLDTLACVCAEQGDFESAIKHEIAAIQKVRSPTYYTRLYWFRRNRTYLQQIGK